MRHACAGLQSRSQRECQIERVYSGNALQVAEKGMFIVYSNAFSGSDVPMAAGKEVRNEGKE